MEIVSADRQRRRYLDGMHHATTEIRLDTERAEALGLDPDRRYTKREIGLAASPKTWSNGIERAHSAQRYRDAMDEVTEPYTPPEAEEPTNMWEQGLLKSSQEDWVQAIVNKGAGKYNEAMDPEYAYAHFRSAMPELQNWLTSISMDTRERTNTFNAGAEVNHNCNRVNQVALALYAQAREQGVPAGSSGNAVDVLCPTEDAMAESYTRAFEDFNAAQEYVDRFTGDGNIPQWFSKALERTSAWEQLEEDLDVIQSNWFTRANAVMEEDFMNEALSERAQNNFQRPFNRENQEQTAQNYIDAYAPYRTALIQLPLEEIEPRGPRGSLANMDRATHVAGILKNAKYIYYGLSGTAEFQPYGEGIIGNIGGIVSNITDEISPF